MMLNIYGIKVEITFYFVAFIAFILSLKVPSNILITVISSLIHECGHIIMMIVLGNKPKKLRFELTGINIIRNKEINISNRNEVIISFGGPLLNLIIVIFCCIYLCFYDNTIVITFACINLILMVFNLLPIKGLDGGNILFHLIIQYCDILFSSKVIKFTSVFFIVIIFIWGVYVLVVSRYNISLIMIAIFLILSLFNDNEY